MVKFNSIIFIKSLKEGYDAIPYIQGDGAAKKIVSNAIKSNGYNPVDVLSFICSMQNQSGALTNAEWKDLINLSIKRDDAFGQALKNTMAKKGNLTNEEYFSFVASARGINPNYLRDELCLDRIGWKSVVDSLVASYKENKDEDNAQKKVEPKKEKTQAKSSSSVKSVQADSRRKPVVGINVKTGEKKVLSSRSAWDEFLGKGRGTAAQAVQGKPQSHKVGNTDWKLYNVGEEPQAQVEVDAKNTVKNHHQKESVSRYRKAVEAYIVTVDGKEVRYGTYPSVTAAANALGVPHTSISKHLNNDSSYTRVGGCYTFKEVAA